MSTSASVIIISLIYGAMLQAQAVPSESRFVVDSEDLIVAVSICLKKINENREENYRNRKITIPYHVISTDFYNDKKIISHINISCIAATFSKSINIRAPNN